MTSGEQAYGFGNNKVPVTRVDHVGAISVVDEGEVDGEVAVFENVDGKRVEDGRYAAFVKEISGTLCLYFVVFFLYLWWCGWRGCLFVHRASFPTIPTIKLSNLPNYSQHQQ